jgi:hypothetical protein
VVGKSERRDHMGGLIVDERIILRPIIEKCGYRIQL